MQPEGRREEKKWAFDVDVSMAAQTVKHLPAIQETQVQFLGWDNPLEESTATHSSTPAWGFPWTEEPLGLQSTGSQRARHD